MLKLSWYNKTRKEHGKEHGKNTERTRKMANPNAKPPEEYKWKPGQSGNPNGRPPKGYSITDMVKEMLGSKPEVKRALVQRIMEKAIEEGDMAAIRLIWQYMDGLPRQVIDLRDERVLKDLTDEELDAILKRAQKGKGKKARK